MLLEPRELCRGRYASGCLEFSNKWFRLDIDLIGQRREGVLGFIIQESALLEKERNILLASGLSLLAYVRPS